MIILGTIAMFIRPAATLATLQVLGWLLVISGSIEAIYAFRVRKWGGLFLRLIGGILGVLIGMLVVTHPVAGVLAWTLPFPSFFSVVDIFRLIGTISLRFAYCGWAIFESAIGLGLGILFRAEWPGQVPGFLGWLSAYA